MARPSTAVCACSEPLALAASCLLEQCASMVRVAGAAGDAYMRDSRTLPGGTIGKHVRHSLDHFRAPLAALETGETIEYDRRHRNTPLETDAGAALTAIDELRARVAGLDAAALAKPVRIRVMLSADGAEAELASTLGRELAFATHHAVHHHAMIGAIAGELGLAVPAGFGKAPSTLQHESRAGAPAGGGVSR